MFIPEKITVMIFWLIQRFVKLSIEKKMNFLSLLIKN